MSSPPGTRATAKLTTRPGPGELLDRRPGEFRERPHALLGEYLGRPPHGQGSITAGQATCDLRRLREHGLIERIPHTHRYKVTSTGLRHAMFLTRVHDRVPRTGLAELAGPGPAPLRKATTLYQAAIDDLTPRAGIAA